MSEDNFEASVSEAKRLYRLLRAEGKVGDWAIASMLQRENSNDSAPSIRELLDSDALSEERRKEFETLLADTEGHAKRFREIFLEYEVIAGRKFEQLRRDRGYSQHEIAERMTNLGFKMHQTTVAKLEQGRRPLRVAELAAMGSIFGLPVEAVLYLPNPKQAPDVEYLAAELHQVDEAIRETEERLLEFVRNEIKTLATYGTRRQNLIDAMQQAAKEIDGEFDRGEHPEAP